MNLQTLPVLRRSLLRACAVVFCLLSWTVPAMAEVLPGETKADTLFNKHSNELRTLMHSYGIMAQGMNDAPKVRIEVESIIQSAADVLSDAARRLSDAKDKYEESAQSAYEEQVELIQSLQNELNDYKAQTPPDEAGIARVQKQIESARADYDAQLARLIGEYEEEIYGAGNGIASMVIDMRNTERHLQIAASLERMLQTTLDTYVAEWLGLAPEVQESLAGIAYRKAIEAAQAAADAPYDSPEAYQAALDALEQAHEDLHDFVTAIDSPVTDRAAVWVRTLDGRTLFRSIAPDEALRRLPRGVFLFDSEKVYVR